MQPFQIGGLVVAPSFFAYVSRVCNLFDQKIPHRSNRRKKTSKKTHLSSDSTFCISVYRNDFTKIGVTEKEGGSGRFLHIQSQSIREDSMCPEYANLFD